MITGGSGLLGKTLIEESPRNVQILSLVRTVNEDLNQDNLDQILCDFSDEAFLEDLILTHRPDVFIHAAAEGRVDFVQENYSLGRVINVEYTRKLATVCTNHSVHFIFISTNAVFGNQQTPFYESDVPIPINKYGELKLEAELLVSRICKSFLILRPILMYGWPLENGRANPAHAWINALRNNKKISVVEDVFSQPLSVYDCARLIWLVCETQLQGILHISGSEHMPLYEFALEVARVFELDQSLISAAKSSDFPSLAPRPTNTMYSHLKLNEGVGFAPKSLRDGLLEMKAKEAK